MVSRSWIHHAFGLVIFLFLPALMLEAAEPESRVFRLRYGAILSEQPDAKQIRVWLPLPKSDESQHVTVINESIEGKNRRETTDYRYGNKILYFELGPESVGDFYVDYEVIRREVQKLTSDSRGKSVRPLSNKERAAFLTANQRVPITGKPLTLLPEFGARSDVPKRAKLIYDRVDELVKYDKSKPGYGNGDVLWVCDSRFGNCTDFHSLFISMARSQKFPLGSRSDSRYPLRIQGVSRATTVGHPSSPATTVGFRWTFPKPTSIPK